MSKAKADGNTRIIEQIHSYTHISLRIDRPRKLKKAMFKNLNTKKILNTKLKNLDPITTQIFQAKSILMHHNKLIYLFFNYSQNILILDTVLGHKGNLNKIPKAEIIINFHWHDAIMLKLITKRVSKPKQSDKIISLKNLEIYF